MSIWRCTSLVRVPILRHAFSEAVSLVVEPRLCMPKNAAIWVISLRTWAGSAGYSQRLLAFAVCSVMKGVPASIRYVFG
jgi:hypothetical protein